MAETDAPDSPMDSEDTFDLSISSTDPQSYGLSSFQIVGDNAYSTVPVAPSATVVQTVPAVQTVTVAPMLLMEPSAIILNKTIETHLTWGLWEFGDIIRVSNKSLARTLAYWTKCWPGSGWAIVVSRAAHIAFCIMVELGPGHLPERTIDTIILQEIEKYVSGTQGIAPRGGEYFEFYMSIKFFTYIVRSSNCKRKGSAASHG